MILFFSSRIIIAILDFSLLLLVKLLLLIFFASFPFSYRSSNSYDSLNTLAIHIPLLFAIAFKIEKERQLYGEQYRKEAKTQCTKNEAKRLKYWKI